MITHTLKTLKHLLEDLHIKFDYFAGTKHYRVKGKDPKISEKEKIDTKNILKIFCVTW